MGPFSVDSMDTSTLFHHKRKQKQDELAESKEYIPTPEEIAIACLEIQKGWTDEERELRARGRLPDFELIQNLC